MPGVSTAPMMSSPVVSVSVTSAYVPPVVPAVPTVPPLAASLPGIGVQLPVVNGMWNQLVQVQVQQGRQHVSWSILTLKFHSASGWRESCLRYWV